jgi:uncharacterized repeat protein (TIGR03803 family)
MNKLNWMTKACGVFLLWAAAAVALSAQTFTSLLSFDGTNGNAPYGALVQGTDGSFYGTTYTGGTDQNISCMQIGGPHGCGTVFKITPSGILTTLYSFCSLSNCVDGAAPAGGLIQTTNGDFYGTTLGGGSSSAGTVFRITSSDTLTVLHSFDRTDGSVPLGNLVQGSDEYFYGAASEGGANSDAGTVFKLTPSGTVTTLYTFDGADGEGPRGDLVQATNGDFYGVTGSGGANNSCYEGNGCGTVFKITPNGALTTLYNFCSETNCADGESPFPLIQGTDGNFYGITDGGGANDAGTVFQITSSGKLTTLYNFCSQGGSSCTDGSSPAAELLLATDGDFYGTTMVGGANFNSGTVFKITPCGTLMTLHSFDMSDGYDPLAALSQATNGEFYGTTESGGVYSDGTVFSLSVGLGQFVETNPTSGKVGMTVKILGSFLTGATSVTFNGTPATFSINSKSEITTTVHTGATTGTVQVITPRLGTLSSNVPFAVRP